MILRNRGQPAGFAKVTGPLMAAAMPRAKRQDLSRLKAILEAGAGPPWRRYQTKTEPRALLSRPQFLKYGSGLPVSAKPRR
jgi:hypothetical protein